MPDAVVTSLAYPNYSGLLFRKGNASTPFSTLIGGKGYTTNHNEFAVGVFYDTPVASTQPAISEEASLTAPDALAVKRSQQVNTTQIFQDSFAISYAKQSNMGSLAGLNVAGQQANPIDEKAFQAEKAMERVAQSVEYTFINGEYQKATSDKVANKTRGILNAITTNVIAAGGKELGYWLFMEALKSISEQTGETTELAALLNPIHIQQVQKDAQENGIKVYNNGETMNGIAVSKIITPFGTINLAPGKYLPNDTALVFNPTICAPVFQDTPGKGNFFAEELAKTGAGEKFQIFGQAGLDYGAEFAHAKITGLKATFTAPENGVLTRSATAEG